jgi:hypothetical protein
MACLGVDGSEPVEEGDEGSDADSAGSEGSDGSDGSDGSRTGDVDHDCDASDVLAEAVLSDDEEEED